MVRRSRRDECSVGVARPPECGGIPIRERRGQRVSRTPVAALPAADRTLFSILIEYGTVFENPPALVQTFRDSKANIRRKSRRMSQLSNVKSPSMRDFRCRTAASVVWPERRFSLLILAWPTKRFWMSALACYQHLSTLWGGLLPTSLEPMVAAAKTVLGKETFHVGSHARNARRKLLLYVVCVIRYVFSSRHRPAFGSRNRFLSEVFCVPKK